MKGHKHQLSHHSITLSSVTRINLRINPFYAIDLFLYPLKKTWGIESVMWHEMG